MQGIFFYHNSKICEPFDNKISEYNFPNNTEDNYFLPKWFLILNQVI